MTNGVRDPFALVGTILERKYRIDRVVAEGGFGVVYAGHHLGLDARVAIKALRPAKPSDEHTWEDLLEQFLLEAKTLARLRSPAVVSVHDAGVLHVEDAAMPVPWIALEWIDGETLQADLERRRARGERGRTPAQCLELLGDVIRAIAEAHENGIAHRDVKPSNVMLERDARDGREVRARVVDFGIAKFMEQEEVSTSGTTATASAFKAFSPAYASPEQVSGMRTGPWTDVHALALVLTEMLTDRAPYPMGDASEMYGGVFDPRRPTPARAGIDVGAWEGVLARALAIKPQDRYATAGELLDALQAALREGDVHVTRESGMMHPSALAFAATESPHRARPSTRTRTWALAAAGGIALAIAGKTLWTRAPSAAAPVPVPACATNADCTARVHAPSVCRDGARCVPLAADGCTVHADAAALAARDTVWIGTLFPLTGENAYDGIPNAQAVELARRDFAEITAGMTGAGEAATRIPPLGVVACNDAVDARRAAAHLVDLGVQAVIGFQSGVEAIDLTTSMFIPNGIVSISAISSNPLVTTVPQPADLPRLVWRTSRNANDTATLMSVFTRSQLEPALRAGGLGPQKAMRVAHVRPKNAPGASLGERVFATLSFNGKTALANGADFREMTYASDAETEMAQLVAELRAFAPHVILYPGTAPLVTRVVAPLEKAWPAGEIRPRYVASAHFVPELLEYLGTDRERRARFFGTMLVSSTPQNARFTMRYNEVFPDRASLTDSPNTTYDAFYLLAYAAYANSGTVTGASLSRAFARFHAPGRRIDVGMPSIFEALSALRRGEDIDLMGSSGTLSLDAKTGERPLDHAILCAGIDARGRAFEGIESGLVFHTATGALEGTLKCP